MKAIIISSTLTAIAVLISLQVASADPISDFYVETKTTIDNGTEQYLDSLQEKIIQEIDKVVNNVNPIDLYYDNVKAEIENGTEKFLKEQKAFEYQRVE